MCFYHVIAPLSREFERELLLSSGNGGRFIRIA